MFDLQGHRFARGLFPENTLEGFDAAVARAWTSFEIDIAITSDGVPVLHHDPALNPSTTRRGGAWLEATGPLLRTLTFAELEAYDVGRLRPGSAYAAAFPDQVAHDGAGVPTLEAVLRRHPAIRFNIELKTFPAHPDWTVPPEEMAERTLHVVRGAGADARVTLQSFDWRAPRHVRRIRPDIACGWLTETEDDGHPDAIAAEGGGTWTPRHDTLTGPLLQRAQALGLRVVPWTVNDPADMRRLRAWGVDGLITDRPDLA